MLAVFLLSVIVLAARGDEAKPIALSRLTPPGGQAGTVITVTATGEFPVWPVSVWTDRGQLSWSPQEEVGKFTVTVPADRAFGRHWVRLIDSGGATAVKPFLVGNVAETAEAEPNDSRSDATAIHEMPVTINGVLEKSGDVDGYRIHLEPGETLVASLVANELLGAPIDAVLELADTGGAYRARNLDAVGLDPRLVYTAADASDVILRVYAFPAKPNSAIGLSGNADSIYRLTITTGGFLTGSLPAAAAVSGTTLFQATGANLPAGLGPLMVATGGAASTWVQFSGVAGVIEVPAVEAALPIAAVDTPVSQPLVPPIVASGWFTQADQVDRHCLKVRKEQKLQVRIESQQAGFEADALLTIRDASGKTLMAKQERDAGYSWTAPADGTYIFEVRDRRGRWGPGHLYRLTVEPEKPTGAASIGADRFSATVGEPISIEIAVSRQFGFSEALEFVLVTAPEGVTAEPVTSSNGGDTAKRVTMTLTAVAPVNGPLRIARRLAGSDGSSLVPFGSNQLLEAWLTVTEASAPETESQNSD